jgi:hypothetical protein
MIEFLHVFYRRGAWCLLAVLWLASLTACATGQQRAFHFFAYGARIDRKGIEVLDYEYGEVKHAPRIVGGISRGARQSISYNGVMPVGSFLYVQWRIRETGQVCEDRVELASRLPRSMKEKEIYFVIDGCQLNIFLIEYRERRPAGWPPIGPKVTQYLKTIEIYPANPSF